MIPRLKTNLPHSAIACDHHSIRRGGGIEPLHVSMPRELKSRPSTSPTHHGSQGKRENGPRHQTKERPSKPKIAAYRPGFREASPLSNVEHTSIICFLPPRIRGSIVVSISACHAEDPGSIPGRGALVAQGARRQVSKDTQAEQLRRRRPAKRCLRTHP